MEKLSKVEGRKILVGNMKKGNENNNEETEQEQGQYSQESENERYNQPNYNRQASYANRPDYNNSQNYVNRPNYNNAQNYGNKSYYNDSQARNMNYEGRNQMNYQGKNYMGNYYDEDFQADDYMMGYGQNGSGNYQGNYRMNRGFRGNYGMGPQNNRRGYGNYNNPGYGSFYGPGAGRGYGPGFNQNYYNNPDYDYREYDEDDDYYKYAYRGGYGPYYNYHPRGYYYHRFYQRGYPYPPYMGYNTPPGDPYYNRPMGSMGGFWRNWWNPETIPNFINNPKVNNILRGIGIVTVGMFLAPSIARALRPIAVQTVQGVLGLTDELKTIVTDAKEDIEDMFAEANWDRINFDEEKNKKDNNKEV